MCDHIDGYSDEIRQQSGCYECDEVRPRMDDGEVAEQTEALDRLDVAISPGHPVEVPERQWRLVAADMAAMLTDEQLASVRQRHFDRVKFVPTVGTHER